MLMFRKASLLKPGEFIKRTLEIRPNEFLTHHQLYQPLVWCPIVTNSNKKSKPYYVDQDGDRTEL